MCARFSQWLTPRQLQEFFNLFRTTSDNPRFNIRPKDRATVIRVDADGHRVGDMLQWGLIPPWSQDESGGDKQINCRSETAANKPSFRRAFRERRCLVPMNGFFEWTQDGQDRQPWFVSLKSGEPIGVAGVWESWKNPDDDQLETFTLMMVDSNDFMAEFHDRMLVVLPKDQWSLWLDPSVQEPEAVQPLMVKSDADIWQRWPVTQKINGNKYDGPDSITPIKLPKRLFD